MATFHDHKLWQDAYVASIDAAEIFDSAPSDVGSQIKGQSLTILTTAADALTRKDRREMEAKFRDVIGSIAAIRSLLSVAWAQELVNDEQFGKLDSAYEKLAQLVK